MNHSPLRRIPLQGAYNTRDLGGYPCPLGATRFGVFLRSDSPHALTQQDLQLLYDYGVRHAIDLRGDDECAKAPSVFPQSTRFTSYHVPLSDVLETPDYEGDTPGSMAGLYISLLEHSGAQLAEIIHILASAEGGTLYHCAVGKDRTGVVSMLLLLLAGVQNEDIVADYAITEIYMHEVFSAFLQEAQKQKWVEAQHPYRTYSKPKSMWRVLRHISEKYGNVASYLASIGLCSSDLEQLRKKFVQLQ